MKKKLFILCITICIGYGIICPDLLAKSAANGLYLWYHSVLPTLLPFGILSGIILRTGMYDAILERISPFLKGIYPLRPPLFYPLIAGYLFGFPLGSKLCADLYDLGKISKNEAVRVSCISNNFGPAFVVLCVGSITGRCNAGLDVPCYMLWHAIASWLVYALEGTRKSAGKKLRKNAGIQI